ncbi:hypothetical protein GOV03_04610 [Candidatus Woesearchaeota archaeon]|nr:hypothetical protein [Candidatus Woesearchaeota archaeon]
MVDSDYQILIEEVVTNERCCYDSTEIKFLRHCTGCDLTGISDEKRLESMLAMMEMRDDKMPVHERLKWLLKNPIPY